VLNANRLWMSKSRWGVKAGQVATAFEPWGLVRVK
jgi:hypothetical protein